jgi:trehalose/maltose transport system substrate-binding protein
MLGSTVAPCLVCGLESTSKNLARMHNQVAILLLAALLTSCGKSVRQPVTLTYPHGWFSEPDELKKTAALSQQFTAETGIRIRDIPTPQSTLDSLDLSVKLLQMGSSGADMLHVDIIWPAVLEPDLIDLEPSIAAEFSSVEPQLLRSYTVKGKVVAIPYQVNVGALEYRSDLLRKYGYQHPPKTWSELESMAERIQAGERAKGKKDFWGYVWQGGAAEGLTCNALEWQAAEGGGRIIESDRTISVNNPGAIRAWQRAKNWIGRISPPGVVAYREGDSMNVFDSGGAAFNRVWLGRTIARSMRTLHAYWRPLPPVVQTGFTAIPGGSGGSGATLGGFGLAVSLHSAHRDDAVKYVSFLTRAKIQSGEEGKSSNNQPGAASVLGAYDQFEESIQQGSPVLDRPSVETGSRYKQVSEAYISAVHSVLTSERGASEAAAYLEKHLVQITGFPTGAPKTGK